MSLAQEVISGSRLALARLLTQVEDDSLEGRSALAELFEHTGRAHLVGVTGAPGTGKSSLVNQLARFFRSPSIPGGGRRVGIIAVDPSSPFSGGAILGDRVRMRDLSGDPGVFIRSMASRGSLGGLANATSGMVQAMDAAGFEIILIETVGAGQAEVDIARLAHTTLVVEAPGLGDEIQAIKAGILEIADILVINKADRPGVENTERALRSMLQLAHPGERRIWHHGATAALTGEAGSPSVTGLWTPPILRSVATEGIGISEIGHEIDRHRRHLLESKQWLLRERLRLEAELDALLQTTLVSRWRETVSAVRYQSLVDDLVERRISPWKAVDTLLDGGQR